MERRSLLKLTGVAAVMSPLAAFAQQSTSLPVVALVVAGPEWLATARIASLRQGIKQAGLVEGRDFVLMTRFANGDLSRMREQVKELQSSKPRVYVVFGGGVDLTHQLAPNTPLVFTSIAVDPVERGWANSYAKPGGMITGNVQNAVGGFDSILTKLFSFLKEVVPNLKRLAVIEFADNLQRYGDRLTKVSGQVGLEFSAYPIRTAEDFEYAVAEGQRDEINAFSVSTDPRLAARIPQAVAAIAKTGKPSCGPFPQWARSGLLMSYSVDWDSQADHAGGQVAKILRGTKPGDLPIEQADKFSLVINLKTAKQLGLTVPPTLLAQADEVIE